MNLLLSKLLHWFVFSGTLMFAAAPVGEVSAPAGGGGGDAGGGGSSSSSTTTTPTTSTTTSTETAPTTTQPTTETTPASLSDAVKRAVANAEKALAKPGVPVETPAAEAPKTEAPKTEAPKTEAPKTETAPAANPLDKIGPLPAEKIAAALKDAPPEVASYLKEKGLDVEALSENARLAAETSQYKQVFPTIDAANEALSGAKNFWKIDSGLAEVKDIGSFDKLMMSLAEMTYVRDDQGNPVPDPDKPGAFLNNGSLAKMVDYSALARDNSLTKLADLAIAKLTDEDAKNQYVDLKGAVEYIKKFVDNGYKFDGKAVDESTLPDSVKAELAEGRKLKSQMATRDTEQQSKDFDTQEDSIIADTHKQISPMISEALSKTALSDKLKSSIGKQVWDAIVESLSKNELYARQRDTLSRRGNDYAQRRVALNLNYLKPVAAKAIAEIVGEIGGPIVDTNAARRDKIDTQTDASRMEPKTSGTTPQSQPGVMSPEDISKKALELAKQTNPNARLGDRDYFAAVTKLKKLPISA